MTERKPFKGRVKWIALGTAAAGGAAAIAYAIWLYQQPRTLDAAAHRVLSCLNEQDVSCLYRLNHSVELKQLGLDRQGYERLFEEYIFPAFDSYQPADEPQLEHYDEIGMLQAAVRLESGTNSYLLGINIHASEEGPKSFLIAHLVSAASAIRHSDLETFYSMSASERQSLSSGFLLKDKELLKDLGVPGIVKSVPDFEVLTWDDYADKMGAVDEEPHED